MLKTLEGNLNLKTISDYLHDVAELKGIYVDTTNGKIEEIQEYYLTGTSGNKYLLTRLIAIMLKNEELKLSYTKKTSKKNKDYLEKLISQNKE